MNEDSASAMLSVPDAREVTPGRDESRDDIDKFTPTQASMPRRSAPFIG